MKVSKVEGLLLGDDTMPSRIGRIMMCDERTL
jgi:hypothetical protein